MHITVVTPVASSSLTWVAGRGNDHSARPGSFTCVRTGCLHDESIHRSKSDWESFMKFAFLLATSIFLIGCAVAPEVTKQEVPSAAISTYRSYMWRTKPPGRNPLGQLRIVADIDAQLRSRGWLESSDGDLAVIADVDTSEKQSTSTFHSQGTDRNWGTRSGHGSQIGGRVDMDMTAPAVKSIHTERISTITLRIVDSRIEKELWHGAIRIKDSNSQARNDQAVDAGIVTLFSGFPSVGGH
jgi:hypothetical protein